MARAGIEKALNLIRTLPRVKIDTLQPLPGTRYKGKRPRGKYGGRHSGRGSKGQGQRNTLPRVGFEGNNTPFYLKIPKEPYYEGHHVRKHYTPVSLLEIQRMIDLGHINTDHPVDMTCIFNTKLYRRSGDQRSHGILLTDEGADLFEAQLNLEVQWCSELAIAAIERNGGTILAKYYDLQAVDIMADPLAFFRMARPIPRVKLPSDDVLPFYSNARNRGYLADPSDIETARYELAQKYGYKLPVPITNDPARLAMLTQRKDPRQMWHGLEPGWVVNLRNRTVLKPTSAELLKYYSS